MRTLRIAPLNGEFVCHGFKSPDPERFASEITKSITAGRPRVEISGREHHHLVHVLRAEIGQGVELKLPSENNIWKTEVVRISENQTELLILGSQALPPNSSITLVIGNIRPQKSELLVEQCAAVGVSEIIFFQAERSQGQYYLAENERKFIRLEKIADVALKQSGFTTTCKIRSFARFTEALEIVNLSDTPLRFLLASPGERTGETGIRPCGNILSSHLLRNIFLSHFAPSDEKMLERSAHSADSILIIGPEGGLSDQEITHAIAHGFEPVSLGLKTLRTETAALAASLLLSMVCSPA